MIRRSNLRTNDVNAQNCNALMKSVREQKKPFYNLIVLLLISFDVSTPVLLALVQLVLFLYSPIFLDIRAPAEIFQTKNMADIPDLKREIPRIVNKELINHVLKRKKKEKKKQSLLPTSIRIIILERIVLLALNYIMGKEYS